MHRPLGLGVLLTLIFLGLSQSKSQAKRIIVRQPVNLPKGPTHALFEDDTDFLVNGLNQAENPPGTRTPAQISRETTDRFSGQASIKVTPRMRMNPYLLGWSYPIVEKPVNPGEFRYIRFAWKKKGGQSMALLLANNHAWMSRYHAGQGIPALPGGKSISVANRIPADWEVVTRDLYKDFGSITITGLALAPYDGEYGLFDHIYLGRSIDDLDKIDIPRRGMKLTEALTGEKLDALWSDLAGDDPIRASAAHWLLAAAGKPTVEMFQQRLKPALLTDAERSKRQKIGEFIQALDDDDFEVRQRATDELASLGSIAASAIQRATQTATSLEAQRRLERLWIQINTRDGANLPPETRRTLRAIKILAIIGTSEAREVLKTLAEKGSPESELTTEARETLERLAKVAPATP